MQGVILLTFLEEADGTGTAEDERERVPIVLGLADELREQLVHHRT